MAWKGKAIGAGLGTVVGGPLGTAIGGVLGHIFDRRDEVEEERAWPKTVFAVFVSAAHANGELHPNERLRLHTIARQLMADAEDYEISFWITEIRKRRFRVPQCAEVLRAVPEDFKMMIIRDILSVLYADDHLDDAEGEWVRDLVEQSCTSPDLWFYFNGFFERTDASKVHRARCLEVLELPPDANDAAIKRAYRELANQYHPDRLADISPALRKLAGEKMREVNEAHRVLTKSGKQDGADGLFGQTQMGQWTEAGNLTRGDVVHCALCTTKNRLPARDKHLRARCGECYALLLLPGELVETVQS